MHRLCDWLALHDLCLADLKKALLVVRRGAARMPACWAGMIKGWGKAAPPAFSTVEDALRDQIQPALTQTLGLHVNLSDVPMRVVTADSGFIPHTLDCGTDAPPEIAVRTLESATDLLCLAHESAHAAQILLSRGSFMPPVTREVCAFLGEIGLVEWTRTHAPSLFPALAAAWMRDDSTYCGTDLEALSQALEDLQTPYEYRMNYPLARAAAVTLFESATPQVLRDFFAAGNAAMSRLPLELIIGSSPLPPIPDRDLHVPATNAYRALGTVALLDLASESAAAQASINEAYEEILASLRTGTLHIALDHARRPVGYACWDEAATASPEIKRRVAPFGPEHLQRSLEARLATRGAAARLSDAP